MFRELTELTEREFLFRHRKLYMEYRRAVFAFDLLNKSVIEGKRLVLYGAGCVGKYYYTQLTTEISCNIVAWVDSNYEKFAGGVLNICSPNQIQVLKYDFILIAVLDKFIAQEIRQTLCEKWGIEKNRILWFKPVPLC